MWTVERDRKTEKELKKAPAEIRREYDAWAALLTEQGPMAVRKINGYWDHALTGEWNGARASSLNKDWRVIYVVQARQVRVLVLKVTPHDYRRKV